MSLGTCFRASKVRLTYSITSARLEGINKLYAVAPASGPADGKGSINWIELNSAVANPDPSPDTLDFLEWITEQKDNPFFLFLSLNIPHANNEAGNKGPALRPSAGVHAGECPAAVWVSVQVACSSLALIAPPGQGQGARIVLTKFQAVTVRGRLVTERRFDQVAQPQALLVVGRHRFVPLQERPGL